MSKCRCACIKDNQNTANLGEDLDNQKENPNELNPENIIGSQISGQQNLKNYIQGKYNSNSIIDSGTSNTKLKGGNILQSKTLINNLDNNGKIIKIQSVYRGYIFRKKYKQYIKQRQIEEMNQLIDDLTNQYTKYNLKKAENLIGTKFNIDGWKTLYSDMDTNSISQYVNYDYGTVYQCKLLIISGIIPSFYIGKVNIDYARHGYGVLLQNDGCKYEGFWRKNYFTGWGRFIDSDGTLYEGCFLNGKLNGKGMKKNLNGNLYIGDFVDNKREGKGKEETNEHIYEGEFKNDKKNGNGKLSYKLLKDTYEGEFKDNCITGTGFYTWANKDTYKGNFVNGKMHGKGLYKWPDGGEYYGDYVNNIKEGNGRFKWVNGKIFEGQFKKGKPNGFGKLKTATRELDVEFKDGKLVTNIKDVLQKEKEREIKNKIVEDNEQEI